MPDWPVYHRSEDRLMRLTDTPALVVNPASAALALLATKLPTNGR